MPNNCFCDQRGIGDSTQTCGDCPEDYRERPKGHPRATKGFVSGAGWCWIEDGEIIEVINPDG